MEQKEQWRYLFDVIRYGVSGGTLPFISGTADWDYLYLICKYHKIEALVCSGLRKVETENGLREQVPEEILDRLIKEVERGRAREAVQHFSLNEILDTFEKAGVYCVPLKGILLKHFYPDPSLRTMADLDILYKAEQKAAVDRILVSMGYVCDHQGDHHDAYFRQPFMNIEMHHTMVESGDRLSAYYKNIWDKVRTEEGKEYVCRMKWEDYYIYMLVHLAKHFRNGGSGIRSVVDLWIFLEQMQGRLDWDYIKRELEGAGLISFEHYMRELASVWFKGRVSGSFDEALTEYIVNSGIYGTSKNSTTQKALTYMKDSAAVGYGTFRVRLEMIFLPLKAMKLQYHYLEKCPALLPLAWVQRIFRTIFKRKGRASSVLGGMKKVDKGYALLTKNLFKKLEL